MPKKSSSRPTSASMAAPSTRSLPASLSDPTLPLPKLVVFDLDYTLWPFWVDTHATPPFTPNAHHTAASDRLGERLAFYHDVPSILQTLSRLAHQKDGTEIRLGVASRTNTPDLARQLLEMLHLPADGAEPSRRALDVFEGAMEIYPGSKLRHFEALHKRTGIAYADMLFFDDESRNRETEQLGVTMRLVRDGVSWAEVEKGIDDWRRRRSGHGKAGANTR